MRERAARGCDGLAGALATLDDRIRDFDAATFTGLVEDALIAAPPGCALPGGGAASAIARAAQLVDRPDDALAVLDGAPETAATVRLRARLLASLDRDADARAALTRALELEDDAETRAQLARAWLRAGDPRRALDLASSLPDAATIRAAALAALDRPAEANAEVARAPAHLRAEIARAAVAAGDPSALSSLPEAPLEILVAAADRATPPDAAALLARAVALDATDADLHLALASARERAGDIPAAIAAYDRAAALAPAAEAPRLAPIRLLATSSPGAARERAAALAQSAHDADSLHLASSAAAAANDPTAAATLARDALAARPDDGQLALSLATRLEEANQPAAAATVLARLLVCGTHGRPFHRHEVAGRLARLDVPIDLDVPCTPVDPTDLATYTAELAAP